MNVKLLREVKAHILEDPKRLFMWNFVIKKGDCYEWQVAAFPACGTVGCIAGWTCILSGKTDIKKPKGFEMVARRLLDLTKDEADRLFRPADWPANFHDGQRDDGTRKTARVAAARIEHFIKTKGKE